MDKRFLVIVLLSVVFGSGMAQVQQFKLPSLTRATQNRLNLQINMLRLYLPQYNWFGCKKELLYSVVYLASKVLHLAADQMRNGQANYLSGQGNIVIGRGNIVIGNFDTVIGFNNWCFTSDYSTPKDKIDEGILAVSKYKIKMSEIFKILEDPRLVISELRPEQLNALRNQNKKMEFFFKS